MSSPPRQRPQQFVEIFQSMETDDCSKGDGLQTQTRKGFMASQVRKDGLLAKAVVIDGREGVECLDAIEVPKVQDCDSPSVLQGKHMQAVSAKNGHGLPASSSSGDA